MLLSVPIDNINIDVGVVINDYHCHLRGKVASFPGSHPEQEREPGNIGGGQTVDFRRLDSGGTNQIAESFT